MSESRNPISEEMLNALVDGEFPPQEKGELLDRAAKDPALAERVCELRNLKDLVQMSYQEVQSDSLNAGDKPKHRRWSAIAAATVMAMIVTLFGWHIHPQNTEPGRMVLLDPDGSGLQPATEHGDETRIVFHLTEPDMTAAAELLDEVESMLEYYRQQQMRMRVEVVAHGEGLDLLRTRLSTQKQHITALSETYPNLTFVACHNSIQRLRVEKGVEVTLVPEAILTHSGVAHVVLRQQQGWAYIQV